MTLAFNLDIQTRPRSDGPETRLPCEFGANPFSGPEIFDALTKK